MGFDIGQFRHIASTATPTDRITVDHADPQAPALQNDTASSGLTWLFHAITEYGGGLWGGERYQQNQEVLGALRAALGDAFDPRTADAVLRDEPVQTLTADRITTLLDAAPAQQRLETLKAAAQPNAQPADLNAALEYIMGEIELPPQAHSQFMLTALRQAMTNVLPQVLRADGTPGLELAGRLGSQLAPRLADYVAYALYAYANRPGQESQSPESSSSSSSSSSEPKFYQLPVTEIIGQLDSNGGLPHLLETVPALAIHLDREVQGFTTCLTTLLERVEQDRSAVGTRFFGTSAPGKLQDITLTNSDPHKQGNRVAILGFGGDRQVVYKPRDVRIDEAISGSRLAPDTSGSRRSLLEAAGAHDMTYTFMPATRDGVDYGYVQFLPHASGLDHVIDTAQAPKAFGDLGRAIGALMLAGATDLHHENIMVSGGRFYFTDLEFALSSQATTQLSALLQPPETTAEPAATSAQRSYDNLMRSMMLNDAFHKATDNNPLCPPYTLDQEGLIQPTSPYDEVIESLVILRGVDQHGQPAYLDNRHRPGEGPNIYSLYQQAFGTGVTAGLTAIQRSNALAAFHTSIAPFHLRYHPISTQDHRSVLQGLRLESFRQPSAAEVHSVYDGTAPSAILDPKLAAILPGAGQGTVREAFRTQMYQAYGQHDVPYFSRLAAGTAMYPDGLADTPLAWDDGQTAYFTADATTHARPLQGLLAGATAGMLTHIGVLAAAWFDAQVPDEDFVFDIPGNKTSGMIADVTGKPV